MNLSFTTALVICLLPALVMLLKHSQDENRDADPAVIAKTQEKEKDMSAVLEEGESIQAACQTYTAWYSAVTNRALITENSAGYHRIPFGNISKIKFLKLTGDKTTNPNSVMQIVVRDADGNTYKMIKYSEKFIQIAETLMQKV